MAKFDPFDPHREWVDKFAHRLLIICAIICVIVAIVYFF